MSSLVILKAIILGIIEGITEFIPVSSTGHLIVAAAFIEFSPRLREVFEIFIQLGAILAIVWLYRQHLWQTTVNSLRPGQSRELLLKVALAFIPAAIVGFLTHHYIEEFLFNPTTVALSLIIGGIIIILAERREWRFMSHGIETTSWEQALSVGLFQLLALIPGVSRSGATIIGGMFSGLDRSTATQFSFYLSIPTISAASLYSLLKARDLLSIDDILPLGIGFAVAFVSALVVVRAFVAFTQSHDFSGFGVYRILVGLAILMLI